VIGRAIALALGQVFDPAFRSVLLKAIGLTLALLAGFYALLVLGLGWLLPDTVRLPWIGEVGFLDTLAIGAALIGMTVASVFLMIPVAAAATGLFLDDVAAAVEAKYYAGLPKAVGAGVMETLRDSLKFLAVLILANLLALVIYLLSTVMAPVVFWIVNGFLLGREYFQLVAMRRLGERGASALRRRHWGTIWLAGTVMAIPLTVPIMNLIVPVIGVAAFTHIFHALNDPAAEAAAG
jgi:CysZ protein